MTLKEFMQAERKRLAAFEAWWHLHMCNNLTDASINKAESVWQWHYETFQQNQADLK